MIRSGLILMIRQNTKEGQSPYAIGKELGISKNTAKKYKSNEITKHGLQDRTKQSKLDSFKPAVDQMVGDGIFNCVVIYERLQQMGYTGRITLIKDYVSPLCPARNCPAERYEKQAQMGWVYIDEHGAVHKTPAFMMILGNSWVKYVEFTKRCDFYSLLRCIVKAFEYFGGVPQIVLTDRMKTVIDGSEAGKPLWNKRFEDFTIDMGFIPKVCRLRRPQTK